MRLNKLTGLVLLCLAFFSSGLVAQDFSAENSKYTPAIYGDKFTYEEDKFYYFNELAGVLFLKGSIEKGMYKDFRQAIADNNIHTLVLESPGGIVLEGVLIAETVFDRKIKTYIRKDQYCASACSFIFLSGKTRYSLGKLGVHQIGYSDEFSKTKDEVGKIAEAVQTVNSRIIQVLDENDTPGFVYKYMLRGEEMYYFNEDELNQLGNSDVSPQDKLLFNRIDNFSKDYNSHLIKQKCDTDPNSCTTAQLCSRAAKDNMWRTSLDATKFVKLAKSKGNRCGVPAPVCPEDIKKCNEEYLCTYGTTGLDASLSWLNNSFADEAKSRGYNCGIIKPILETKPKPKKSCYTDHRLCSYEELCIVATITVNGKKDWTKISNLKEHVKLAKKTSFSCGVEKTNKIIKKVKCSEDPSQCSNKLLCNYASSFYTKSGPIWNESAYWAKHVSEAKRRGLSCGVKKKTPAVKNKTCFSDPKLCNDNLLCNNAVEGTVNNPRWGRKPYFKKYITEAKRRGLTCGVKIKSKIKTKSCVLDIKNCTSKQLCARGTRIVNSNFLWQTNVNFKKYVTEAKRRGLSCGVKKKKPIINEMVRSIQKQLNRLGCNAGTADGILGRKTLSALKRWKSAGGNYTPNKIDQRLRSSLFESPYKCSSAQTSSTSQASPGLLSGTWDVTYSRCDNKRYRSILSLYNSKFNEYEAKYNVQNRIYKGKLKINGDKYSIALRGPGGSVSGNGIFNKTFTRAQGRDHMGCLFDATKR
ncbi:hypothetical protein OAH82_02695 [Amylibacter sp.]|nr:hypothetical protein [Amylibacter sp.]